MAATTLSTTPGYGQYASAADTGYGAAVGSPPHNHQHPLHFGEEISTQFETSKQREKSKFQDCPPSHRRRAPRFRGTGPPDRVTPTGRSGTKRRRPLPAALPARRPPWTRWPRTTTPSTTSGCPRRNITAQTWSLPPRPPHRRHRFKSKSCHEIDRLQINHIFTKSSIIHLC